MTELEEKYKDRGKLVFSTNDYLLIKGSRTGHCCFAYSIVKTNDESFEGMGEFIRREEAMEVFELLTGVDVDEELEREERLDAFEIL